MGKFQLFPVATKKVKNFGMKALCASCIIYETRSLLVLGVYLIIPFCTARPIEEGQQNGRGRGHEIMK